MAMTNAFYLVGRMSGGFCVYQCKGRLGHDGGPVIAECATVDLAESIASNLNKAGVVYDLSEKLPQFITGD